MPTRPHHVYYTAVRQRFRPRNRKYFWVRTYELILVFVKYLAEGRSTQKCFRQSFERKCVMWTSYTHAFNMQINESINTFSKHSFYCLIIYRSSGTSHLTSFVLLFPLSHFLSKQFWSRNLQDPIFPFQHFQRPHSMLQPMASQWIAYALQLHAYRPLQQIFEVVGASRPS